MRRFRLYRKKDVTGVSGPGHVAEGVLFSDGVVVLRWRGPIASTIVHNSIGGVFEVHCHGGNTAVEWIDPGSTPFERGITDAYQDRCENVPFASIGGLEARLKMHAPDCVHENDCEEYLSGYSWACKAMFGDDWATCQFGWRKAMELGVDENTM